MTPDLRQNFDLHVESVLNHLPPAIHSLLETIPLHVEDYPPDSVRRKMKLGPADLLYGLYTGTPLPERHVEISHLPDVITIYRYSLLNSATLPDGSVDENELCRQIRITILHELAHHHGFTEEELEEMGY
ncbi:MAG: metallopeptidase family protein [Planctomycetia bacterium]|nr:metallopeptidase family protein [Planctomycetia bacterium]